ncbi:hypothetical protein ILFOPFJJ_04209 [Ensifer psoraleae]|uniref:hypothetical protein n=1 Tax=Sinorhizobium TaxID=28105 RepID=UPI001567E03F|nr:MULTISPECIES: hypothetical protein [Sinorhizobium]MDK1389117.1 hypothetical protein [Sinorhizobium sp. 7-81]NRP73310.1 hypothetical protein [Sinorhizobium psoraleae]
MEFLKSSLPTDGRDRSYEVFLEEPTFNEGSKSASRVAAALAKQTVLAVKQLSDFSKNADVVPL